MRQMLVAGNWKLNGSKQTIRQLVQDMLAGIDDVPATAVVAVCPPYIYIPLVARLLADTRVVWGAQNVSEQENGAFTGEVAISMLQEYHCRYIIVGHSERRALYGDTDAVVAKKFVAVRDAGLTPILCVGETLEERESGITEAVVGRQLAAVREEAGGFDNAVIAYEPVWAIGTGKTATPDQAQAVHAFIRQTIQASDSTVADKIQLLYGGSVKGSNASELFAMSDIDGGLIGGAALKAQDFLAICRAAG